MLSPYIFIKYFVTFLMPFRNIGLSKKGTACDSFSDFRMYRNALFFPPHGSKGMGS